MHISLASFLFLWTILPAVSGHPGEHEDPNPEDVLVRREFLHGAKRDIARCQSALRDGDVHNEAMERRAGLARKLREKNGLSLRSPNKRRDFGTVLNTNHASDRQGLGPHPSDQELFSGNLKCVLQPEVTVGPYWVKGEIVRNDISENQQGIPLYMEYQIIDTTTCKPRSGVYVDVWHANATGIYSGVVARSNGNRQDFANAYRTHHRGIQKTDSDGVVSFKTTFPGHYTGRTHHVHLITTIDASQQGSGAIAGGHISHVGQIFFDQALTNIVEQTSPYNTNTQQRTSNQDDSIMREESSSMDPVFEYVWLGSKPADGLLAWITIGIDPRAMYTPRAAATAGNAKSSGGVRARSGWLFGM